MTMFSRWTYDTFYVIGNVGDAERCCDEVRFETQRCVKMR